MRFYVALGILLLSANISAKLNRSVGEWGSGGGNALVCFNNISTIENGKVITGTAGIIAEIKKNNNTIPDKYLSAIKSIEMFDLYEAKKRRGLDTKNPEIIQIRNDEKIYDYFDRLSVRFKKRINMMSNMVEAGKELIPDTQLIFHEFAVMYQNDLGNVTLPTKDCVISTMAVQVNEDDYYVVHIDERLYEHPKHSKQSKATLILHELVYALARKHFDHSGSGATRNLIRYFISYHETFTEGLVSKAIYDLGFGFGEYYGSDIVHRNRASEIMMFVSTGLDSQHQSMVDMIEYNHKSGRNRSLYKKIKEQIIIEKLASPGDFSDDFSGQSKLINIALNRSTNIHYWSLIDTEFTQILNDIAVEISGANIRNQKGILKTIKKNTEISDVDFENLKGHIASFNSDHLAFHVNVEWYYTNILIPRMDKKLLFNEVYSNFLSSTVCNITSSTGTVIVSPNFTSEEEKCFYPVKLDNIIPKA